MSFLKGRLVSPLWGLCMYHIDTWTLWVRPRFEHKEVLDEDAKGRRDLSGHIEDERQCSSNLRVFPGAESHVKNKTLTYQDHPSALY